MVASTPASLRALHSLDHACAELYRLHQSALMGFSRLHGCDEHDAQDAVQELFTRAFHLGIIIRLVESPVEAQRAWLQRVLRWIIANQARHRRALRRGGPEAIESLERLLEDGLEVPGPGNPAADHDRAWVWGVIDRSLARLQDQSRGERQRVNGAALFQVERSGTSPAARVALHRMRRRLRDIMMGEMARWRTGEDIRDMIRASMAG